MSKIRIAGCDPGFANLALSVVDRYVIGGSDLLDVKLITTKKGTSKIKQSDDEKRRLNEIEDEIIAFLDEWRPDVLASEEPGRCLMKRGNKWVPNPTLMRTSYLMWGSLSGICRARGIYLVSYTAKQIKQAACGKTSASKTEVEEAMKELFPTFDKWPTTKKVEHVSDAVGAAVTAFKESFVMTLLRKLEGAA
jgi:Holliday junction resolvasome RuvABC endonuclease subunit